MPTITLEPHAIIAAGANIPANTPVFMLNLLRFREQADYGARTDLPPCSGREAYFTRYAAITRGLMAEISSLFWRGPVAAGIIAPPDEHWDEILLVEYPDYAAFRQLVEHPVYLRDAAFHRTAALADSRLFASLKAL